MKFLDLKNKKGADKMFLSRFAKRETNFLNDKKGGDKMLSIYWFAILFIVAAAVVYMVVLFYGRPYDVRSVEADFLSNKVSDCLTNLGYLKSEVFSEEFEAGFLDECNINFAVEDTSSWKNDQFFLELKIFDFDTKNELVKISEGNSNLKDVCSDELNKQPFCKTRQFYSLDENNRRYTVEIFTVVRKTEKNVA